MNTLQSLWHWHPAICGVIAMWLFANFVSTMPTPTDKAPEWYIWMFRYLHVVGAGLPRLIATVAPASAVGKLLISGSAPENTPAPPP